MSSGSWPETNTNLLPVATTTCEYVCGVGRSLGLMHSSVIDQVSCYGRDWQQSALSIDLARIGREPFTEVIVCVPERTLVGVRRALRPTAEQLGPLHHVTIVEWLVEVVRRLMQMLLRPAFVDLANVLALRRRSIARDEKNPRDAAANERVVIGSREKLLPRLEVRRDSNVQAGGCFLE